VIRYKQTEIKYIGAIFLSNVGSTEATDEKKREFKYALGDCDLLDTIWFKFYRSGKSSGLISKNISEDKELKKKIFLEEIQSKEVVEILSESEKETSEQKSEVDFSWKHRLPKQSSKYIPEKPNIKQ